jgi:hypothetical protein
VRVSVRGVEIADLDVGMGMLWLCNGMLVRRVDDCLRRVLTMSPGVAKLGSEKRESEEQPQNRGGQA